MKNMVSLDDVHFNQIIIKKRWIRINLSSFIFSNPTIYKFHPRIFLPNVYLNIVILINEHKLCLAGIKDSTCVFIALQTFLTQKYRWFLSIYPNISWSTSWFKSSILTDLEVLVDITRQHKLSFWFSLPLSEGGV